jgi:hypothetical protein
LDFQHGSHDQHFGQTAFVGGRQDHPADAGIHGQTSQLAADVRQLAAVVDRAQLEQRPVAVLDRVGARRIEEWKLFDRSQP